MKTAPRISEAEWEVMRVVWRKSPCLAQDIIQAFSGNNKWTPATIKTLINRLMTKGVVRYEKAGKSYIYSPAFTEQECRTTEANSFLHRVFDGALSPMLAHFVQSRRLTPTELDALEIILREKKRAK
jgi:BlaI family transcriptional regulator, penicillinase repressor